MVAHRGPHQNTVPCRVGAGTNAPGLDGKRIIRGTMERTVLIVDDHAGFRASARALLEADGFVVAGEAADGAEAVALAGALRPAIVLLDIALPGLDGFAVAALLAATAQPAGGDPRVQPRALGLRSPYRCGTRAWLPAQAALSGAAIRALTG